MADEAPRTKAAHWRWFRRLMAWMLLFSLAMVALAIWWMSAQGVTLRPHFVIAMGLGIALSLMLGAGLMGLVFVSSRSGADERVGDFTGDGDGGETLPPARRLID